MFNLEKVICFMDWNSLFNGFLGSLVGAGITAIVVYQTARWQVKKTFKLQIDWERNRILERETAQRRSIVQNLLGELQDNLEIAKEAHDHYSWALVFADIWTSTRGEIWFLTNETQKILRQIYMHVQRYISKAEDRRAAKDFGIGGWDRTMKDEIDYLTKEIPTAIGLLEDQIKQNPNSVT